MESQLSATMTYSLYGLQVSGKAPKLVTADNKTILKCYIEEQYQFYKIMENCYHTNDLCYSLKKYLPLFKGDVNLGQKPKIDYNGEGQNKEISIWLEHVKIRYDKKNQSNKFVLMQNFLYNYTKPNILDIKIGGRQQKPNKITKSVLQYKIRLNGMIKTNKNNQSQFISKYILNEITEYKDIVKHIGYFFNNQGRLNSLQLKKVLEKLKDLTLSIRSMRGWKFVSTSICLFFDAERNSQAQIKFIDFGRATNIDYIQNYDEDTSTGVQNIIKIISQLIQNQKDYENIQIQKGGQVVPPSKVKKFESQKIIGQQNSPKVC